MEEEKSNLDQLIDHSQEYLKTRQELARLQVAEKIATGGSSAFAGMMILGMFMLVILFASVAAALYISSRYEAPWTGFAVVGGFYLLVTLLFVAMKDRLLKRPVQNSIIKNFLRHE